jgi:hypothetical protein
LVSGESSELSPDGVNTLASPSIDTSKKNSIINVNESIISLMLKLHSKYSNRKDSYVPIFQRRGFSAEADYRQEQKLAFVLRLSIFGQLVPLLNIAPPFFPIILFVSAALLTGMTSSSLHMQWPLTSQSQLFSKRLIVLYFC